MRKQLKYPYPIRVLEERLVKEHKMMVRFKKPIDFSTAHKWSKEWQDTNINTCEHRINALVGAIEHLKKEFK